MKHIRPNKKKLKAYEKKKIPSKSRLLKENAEFMKEIKSLQALLKKQKVNVGKAIKDAEKYKPKKSKKTKGKAAKKKKR